MKFEVERNLAAPVRTVLQMFGDEEFSRERAMASGALSADVVIDGEAPDAEFTVSIRRTMPTAGIRPDLQRMIGDTIAVHYTEAWEADSDDAEEGETRVGTFAVDIVGVPSRAHGIMNLRPEGAGSVISVDAEVLASVPLVQHLVEAAVGEALQTAIEREFDAADAWLARA